MAKFRAVTEADRAEVQAWIDADPGHAGRMTADFFIEKGPFHSVYAIGDKEGTVMYARQEAEGYKMRIHLQFCGNKRRVVQTFRDAYPLVAIDAKKRNFHEIVFESCSPALVKFLMMEFKFVAECTAVL